MPSLLLCVFNHDTPHSELIASVETRKIRTFLIFFFLRYNVLADSFRSGVFEIINAKDFFYVEPRTLRLWGNVVKNIVTLSGIRTIELVVPYPRLFLRKKSKVTKFMVRYIKRLSFVVHACTKDQFGQDNRFMTTTILDGLSLQDPQVHMYCLLLVRVMLLQMLRPTMIPIWPVILAELLRILSEAKPNSTSDNKMLRDQPLIPLAAFKVADTANLLQLDEFQLHNYIFMPDLPDEDFESDDESQLQGEPYQPFSVVYGGNKTVDDGPCYIALQKLEQEAKPLEDEKSPAHLAKRNEDSLGGEDKIRKELAKAAQILNGNRTLPGIVARSKVNSADLSFLILLDLMEMPTNLLHFRDGTSVQTKYHDLASAGDLVQNLTDQPSNKRVSTASAKSNKSGKKQPKLNAQQLEDRKQTGKRLSKLATEKPDQEFSSLIAERQENIAVSSIIGQRLGHKFTNKFQLKPTTTNKIAKPDWSPPNKESPRKVKVEDVQAEQKEKYQFQPGNKPNAIQKPDWSPQQKPAARKVSNISQGDFALDSDEDSEADATGHTSMVITGLDQTPPSNTRREHIKKPIISSSSSKRPPPPLESDDSSRTSKEKEELTRPIRKK